MNISPNVNLERIEEADLKLQFQLNKCLNEKRRRESANDYLEELAGFFSASASDMCALSVNPDKCAILQETVSQLRQIKLEECGSSDDLQKSEVSSSNPNILGSDLLAPVYQSMLHALDGFLFMVNTDGKIEFVSPNVKAYLKYHHENLIDKSIYNIIHVGDHARFSSNLLPMSIGNGFGWSEPNESVSKSRSFNCRFLIKPPEDQEETMEEKQTRVSQYENMQISAVLLPYSGEKTETDDLGTDIQNRLVCVARRLPPNEKGNLPAAEQFLTRLDLRGKIISIDTSGVSSTYSQYLNKDLVGCIIQELCHPDDFQKLAQHLKETLQQGSNTSGIYRLRLAQEKIVFVQTKSKRLNFNHMASSEQEIIIATHTILRDSDHCLENVVVPQRSNPSPASVPSLGSTMNGNTYSFSSMSPQDFNFNDIGMEFLPSSSWDLGGGEGQELDVPSLPNTLGGPSTPASNNSSGINSGAQQQRTQHPSGSAFSPELVSGRGSPAMQSPAQLSTTGSPAPGRVTPFSNSFAYSPVSTQTLSRTSSPAPNLIKREEQHSVASSNAELSNLSPIGGLISDSQNCTSSATQKLRNLLTHGMEEADSSVPKHISSEKMEDVANTENGFASRNANDSVSSHNENIILRELLNQDDEDISDEASKNLSCDSNCNLNISSDMGSNDPLQKRTMNNNNMLRKLLNNGEDKSFKKNQDVLIQQLLKTEGKVSGDINLRLDVKAGCPSPRIGSDSTVGKRKSPDTPVDDSAAKRPAAQNPQHAHLAGQNPMLASMLAQTPRTAPSVPTSMANAIVSQLPQERLPKNLEKKLVHTPYTGTTTGTTSSTQYSSYSQVQIGSRSLLSTSLQQEVVTADSRGHMTLAPQALNPSNFPQMPNFGSKFPSNDSQNINLQIGSYGNQFTSAAQQQSNIHAANMLLDSIAEASKDPNNIVNTNDPDLSDILDQVWSLEQEMNYDNVTEEINLYKLLDDPPPSAPAASPKPVLDVHEKLAIHAIQKQLMSYEGASINSRSNTVRFQQPMGLPQQQAPTAVSSYSQINQFQAAPPAYTMSNARTRAPILHTVQNNVMPTSQQMQQQMAQMNNQRQTLLQYSGINSVNDLTPPMRQQLVAHKQKLYLQQQQKRLLIQQQKQQLALNNRQGLSDSLQSPSSTPFADNMNDLINNTVAPNVTLQRSTSMPEPQLSPRYSNVQQITNSIAPPASPSQLSPGQRQQPSFPSLSQPGYTNNYPQSRLSPHMQPQGAPNQAWVQRASQNSANLQQQNPMLNAQLSQQQQAFANQTRFSNQQQQQPPRQLVMHSMPSPGSRNSPYSNPPDSPFHPPSPGVALYQQQAPPLAQQPPQPPQQRLQRAVSIPNRVNSPRSLPAGFSGGDPILSPQPSPGNYNPPVSNYNAMSASSASNYSLDNFSYDQQVYPQAMMDRSRNNNRSEYVRQELRAKVGARNQQHQVHQQQLVQQMPQPQGSQSTNQSLSQADFDALGFSLDLDGQPTSPALYPQSLLNAGGVGGGNENQSQTGSPRFQLDEQRPAEPKKSLLQQLLSEPP